MKRILTILVVNLVIIGVIAETSAFYEKYEDKKREEAADYYLTSTTILMEEDMDKEWVVSEIRDVVLKIPPEIIKTFNEDGYKIIIASRTGEEDKAIDFKNRSITIRYVKEKGMIRQRLFYEFGRYIDSYYDFPSGKETFMEIYEMEGEMYGAETAEDYFASVLSDYLQDPDETEHRYPAASAYFSHLLEIRMTREAP